MLRILIVVNGRPAVEQLASLAIRWRDDNYAESVFWLAHSDDAEYATWLGDRGFQIVGPGADASRALTGTPARGEAPTSAGKKRFGAQHWLGQFARQVVYPFRIAFRSRVSRAVLRRSLAALAPNAVITAQERPMDFLPLVAAAKDLRVPVVLVPSNFLCQPDGGAFMRRHDARLQTNLSFAAAAKAGMICIWLMNKIIVGFKPRQVFASRFGAMLCYPGDYLLGLWLGGLLTENMWHQGTRFVDRVVISGIEEETVCHEAGLPAARIAKLGNPVFEALMATVSQRSTIRRRFEALGIDVAQKITIFAVPVAWEHKMITRKEQFAMLEAVLPILHGHGTPVVLSLHPRSREEDYRDLAARFGMPIVREPLMDVLAGGDVFVGGAYSSTIRWAIALGLPAVNLDFWDLKESTYAAHPDYPTVEDAPAFARWLGAAVQAPWQGPERLCVPERNVLGIAMDGQFSKRVQLLVDQLVTAARPA